MNTKKTVLAGLMIALGMVLPLLTMQIPEIGSMLLPMHLPVLLGGFICGPAYGALVGFIVPILRSLLFGMPVLMPMALAMAFELLAYGLVTGLLYNKLKKVKFGIYLSLIPALLIGRIVWGIAAYLLFSMTGKTFTIALFISGAFVNAVPGIILQLILIPIIVASLKKNKLV
ncbi:MAG: ECF transporter S component [Vallitaleaceae bacterium]|nr:ECF transporter S component [Vallitaleaceae bacterium]